MKEYRIVATENQVNEEPVIILDVKKAEYFFRRIWVFDLQVQEAFYALYVDRANNVIGYTLISLGGINGTVVDTRIILKYGIDLLATGVILAHNHPSGNKKPSDADLRITKRISEACTLCEIVLIDHLIITEKEVYSMKNEGDI